MITLSSEEALHLSSAIVDETRTTWAINTLKPYKSPGLDGVVPALLQWGCSQLVPHLVWIFRACITLTYVPLQWREVKVVYIPKPGRSDYSTPKSYRPISLTSVLLKTLERLCDRYIRETALILNSLHPNQHAYIQGRSTETALHAVVSKIDKSLEYRNSTLGIFIDIEGAFDKATFDSIVNALKEHGVEPPLFKWIQFMLEHRTVQFSSGDSNIKGYVTRGCPQGGVLSPLLWITVVDSLLRLLNNKGYHAIGYADDITILLDGKFENILADIANNALKIIETWCEEHSFGKPYYNGIFREQ